MFELGDKEFRMLSEIIYRESGINLTESKKSLMQARLMKRMRELAIGSYKDYCDYLQRNYDSEITSLINCITTNKTDFFREARHFDFLRNVALPELGKSGRKMIRIWSAGCSTGEEPYTIAMSILEYYAGKPAPEILILATDIDTSVLDQAEKGVYRAESVEGIDGTLIRRYFLRGRGLNAGEYLVKEGVRKLIRFRRLNLLDDHYPMRRMFDIIFCRNVVIYFDKESQLRLMEHFYHYLADDGYLFIGHSESLTGVSDRFYFITNTIYRKVTNNVRQAQQ